MSNGDEYPHTDAQIAALVAAQQRVADREVNPANTPELAQRLQQESHNDLMATLPASGDGVKTLGETIDAEIEQRLNVPVQSPGYPKHPKRIEASRQDQQGE